MKFQNLQDYFKVLLSFDKSGSFLLLKSYSDMKQYTGIRIMLDHNQASINQAIAKISKTMDINQQLEHLNVLQQFIYFFEQSPDPKIIFLWKIFEPIDFIFTNPYYLKMPQEEKMPIQHFQEAELLYIIKNMMTIARSYQALDQEIDFKNFFLCN